MDLIVNNLFAELWFGLFTTMKSQYKLKEAATTHQRFAISLNMLSALSKKHSHFKSLIQRPHQNNDFLAFG